MMLMMMTMLMTKNLKMLMMTMQRYMGSLAWQVFVGMMAFDHSKRRIERIERWFAFRTV